MKKLVLVILLLSLFVDITAQEFRKIEPQLVNVFSVGDSGSSLGYQKVNYSSANVGPTAFCFDLKGNLVISDLINQRICIFDQNWQLIKNILLTQPVEPSLLEIDLEGNYIGYYGVSGVVKIDSEGNVLFFLYVGGEDVANSIRSDGFFVIDDLVLAYDKNDSGIIGFSNLTPDFQENNKKPIMDTPQVINELERTFSKVQIEKKETFLPAFRTFSTGVPVPSRNESSNEYVILKDGEVLSRDFDSIQQLKSSQGQMLRSIQPAVGSDDERVFSLYNKYKKRQNKQFQGIDKDGNQYWDIGRKLFVLDPNGNPIEAFLREGDKRTTNFVVSDNGDIYYMYSTESGHYLYKYARDW